NRNLLYKLCLVWNKLILYIFHHKLILPYMLHLHFVNHHQDKSTLTSQCKDDLPCKMIFVKVNLLMKNVMMMNVIQDLFVIKTCVIRDSKKDQHVLTMKIAVMFIFNI